MRLLLFFIFSFALARELLVPQDYGSLSAAAGHVQSNDTVVLDPSRGPFDCGAAFLNLEYLSIRSAVSGQSAVLDCKGAQRGIVFVNVSHIALEGLGVTGGFSPLGGAAFASGDRIYMTIGGCSFWNNTATTIGGGALFFYVMQSVIVEADGSSFMSNVAWIQGGAIMVQVTQDAVGASVRLAMGASVFVGNGVRPYATNGGGAIAVTFLGRSNSSRVEIEGGMYGNNTSVGWGGAIFLLFPGTTDGISVVVRGGSFFSNIAANSGLGGGAVGIVFSVASRNSSVAIEGGSYTQNFAAGGGGAILIFFSGTTDGNSVRVTGGSYFSNTAVNPGRRGGAIGVLFLADSSDSSVDIEEGNFTHNTDGAIFVQFSGTADGNSVLVTNGSYLSNTAANSGLGGGAIGIFFHAESYNCSVATHGGSYAHNFASGGGAIFVLFSGTAHQNSVRVTGGWFLSNAALNSGFGGGAVSVFFFLKDQNCSIIVEGGEYAKNTVSGGGGGGAICASFAGKSSHGIIRVSGVAFTSNTVLSVGAGGGAICVSYYMNCYFSTVSIEGCIFSNNFSDGKGGCIYITYGRHSESNRVSVLGGEYTHNSVSNSEPGGGGVIFILYVTSSYNSSLTLEGGMYANNAAPGGGVIQVMYFGTPSTFNTVSISGGTFSSNAALLYALGGGVLYIIHNNDSSSNSITLRGNSFFNNTSAGGGGVISLFYFALSSSDSVLVGRSSFVANRALFYEGGAIIVLSRQPSNDFSLAIDRCVFSNNQARALNGVTSPGGAVAMMFQNSSAATAIRISNSEFSHNAGSDGGAFSLVTLGDSLSLQARVENCSFRSNTASLSGGAASVSILGSGSNMSVSLRSCSLSNNSAQGAGGAALSISMPTDAFPSRCRHCNPVGENVYYPPSDCGYDLSVADPGRQYCSQGLSASSYVRNVFASYVYWNSVNVSDCEFVSNAAPNGRGIVFLRNGNVTLAGRVSFASSAGSSCAGLALDGSARLTTQRLSEVSFVDSVVSSDNAADSGAAILSTSTGELRLEGALLAVQYSGSAVLSRASAGFGVVSVRQSARGQVSPGSTVEVACPPGYQLVSTASSNKVAVFSQSSQFFNEFSMTLLTNVAQLSCSPCGPLTYVTTGGRFAGGALGPETQRGTPSLALNVSQAQPLCEKCPLGLVCSGSNSVMIEKDYWGTIESESGVWRMTRCATGYCCQSEDGCAPGSTEACAAGRDPQVPLCGACLAGYSKDLRGPGCTLSEECDHWEWYWPFVIALGVGYGAFVVHSAASDRRVGSGWEIESVSFFAQNAQLVLSATSTGLSAGRVVDAVHVVFGLSTASQTESSSSSSTTTSVKSLVSNFNTVCALPGITTDSAAIALQLVTPGIVFATVGLLFGVGAARGDRGDQARLGQEGSNGSRLREIAIGSCLSAAQFLYTKVSTVTFQLLHCVAVGGEDGQRMLLEGAVRCGSRQWLVGLVGGVPIVLFPLALVGWQHRARKRCRAIEWAERPALQALERPYRKELWFWGSLTLCRRLAVSFVTTFAVWDQSVQGIMFAVLFGLFILLQAMLQPFVERGGNLTESVSLLVLLFISVCGIRAGTLSVVEVDVSRSEYETVLRAGEGLVLAQTVLFFVPIVIGVVIGLIGRRQRILAATRYSLGVVYRRVRATMGRKGQGSEMTLEAVAATVL